MYSYLSGSKLLKIQLACQDGGYPSQFSSIIILPSNDMSQLSELFLFESRKLSGTSCIKIIESKLF